MTTIQLIALYIAIFTAGMLVGYLLKVVLENRKRIKWNKKYGRI